ncbi:MAG: glutamate 5-kinase [Candidatus Puniceispirillaceae bacterium]|jgi:glutamate 5-kinase|nr:glutamate 5-kinase [Pseudomonadota bacterium]NBX06706.1 glutamate 5-kinase [Pseudomonadota bacterium]
MRGIRDLIKSTRLVVIKIGSALIVDPATGKARADWMRDLAADVASLRAAGTQVVLISSGSIALGRQHLSLPAGAIKLPEKQAAAAIGQVELAQLWSNALQAHDMRTAQILLAPEDTETRRRHINARTTIQTLLELGFVPVVNENDTVTTYEIRFGDNDRLAARVAGMISADLLILLSDVDGLYTKNPHQSEDAEHIPEITQIDEDIMALGGGANAEFASGGMATKLAAARIATEAGADMVICKGSASRPVTALLDGARYSLFHRRTSPKKARKNWIAGALDPKGQIVVDKGAQSALLKGKSLLPVGILRLSGQFDRGDLVQIINAEGIELGHGLAGYATAEAEKIKGQKSQVIETLLGYEGRAELIHADDLVLRGDLTDN